MKKFIPAIALVICSTWLVSCSNAVKNVSDATPTPAATTSADSVAVTSTPAQINTEASNKTAITQIPINPSTTPTKVSTNPANKVATTQPRVGTVKKMVSGDLECYVTLVDEAGKQQEVGASFNICDQEKAFLNKKVRLVYQVVAVNDCQSAEPCGKTRKESLIAKMELQGDSQKSQPSNSQTVSNGEWTITIGNRNSWSGVNGTGNLTYSGCDNKGHCVKLTGGKVVCRDGICTTGWSNRDYSYIIKQAMGSDGSDSSSTLTLLKGSNVILNVSGLKNV